MGLKDFLQQRQDDIDLGKGVWRRAHDRFKRGIDRFHQILEQLPSGATLELVVPEANRLADLLPRVRSIAQAAQSLAPSQGNDVPYSPAGIYADLHRDLSKAGNAVALCAEALAMTRCAGSCALSCQRELAVQRRVQSVVRHVCAAEEKLEQARLQEGSAPGAAV